MPTFLSRIRHRGSSTQPQPSTQSVTPPSAPASVDVVSNPEVSADVSPSPLVGLKIRPDLNSLLESYETEDLSPKNRSKEGPVAIPLPPIQDGYTPLPLKPHISRNILTKSPEPTLPVIPISTGLPTLPIFAEASPLGGTFGRQQFPPTNLNSVGSGTFHHKAPTRSRSLGDAKNGEQTPTSAPSSGWNFTQTNQLPLSETFKRPPSVRSLPDKKRRINRRKGAKTRSSDSLRTSRSSSPARPHPCQTSARAVHQPGTESPRTFGYPTPPYSTRTFGPHEGAPPLPPLDHPELTTDARGPGPVTLGVSHKPSNSTTAIPHVDNIFDIPQELASGPPASRKSVARKRSKTLSVDSRRSSRRSSAEWSAVQATEGVLANSNSWQAQVSREIVRLSFGESAPSPGIGDPGSSRDVPHVAATRHPPVKTFVSPRPPPSLGSPFFFQGRPNPLHTISPRLNRFFCLQISNLPLLLPNPAAVIKLQ